MVKKIIYIAKDEREFENRNECIEYEKTLKIVDEIYNFIDKNEDDFIDSPDYDRINDTLKALEFLGYEIIKE